jgi:hypothetical protein
MIAIMTEMIRITGLARHPDAYEHIIELIKDSKKYENEVFNIYAQDLLDAWKEHSSQNPDLDSKLVVSAGVGILGVASTVHYDAKDKRIINRVDETPSRRHIFSDLAKAVVEDSLGQEIQGIVFGNVGGTTEVLRNGVWIPEAFAAGLSIQVQVSVKSKE